MLQLRKAQVSIRTYTDIYICTSPFLLEYIGSFWTILASFYMCTNLKFVVSWQKKASFKLTFQSHKIWLRTFKLYLISGIWETEWNRHGKVLFLLLEELLPHAFSQWKNIGSSCPFAQLLLYK